MGPFLYRNFQIKKICKYLIIYLKVLLIKAEILILFIKMKKILKVF